jgi:hypothetical protein
MFMRFRKFREDGHVAEWLRSGLQNRLPRFNSGRGLQAIGLQRPHAVRTFPLMAFNAGFALLYACARIEQVDVVPR